MSEEGLGADTKELGDASQATFGLGAVKEGFRSGYVAIVGEANAGKSTLLNALLGEKVSIVCHKVQTTRERIVGIKTTENFQAIFLDTPGFIESRSQSKLGQWMARSIKDSVSEADVVVLVVDSVRAIKQSDVLERIASYLKDNFVEQVGVVLLNKVDGLDKTQLLPLMSRIVTLLPLVLNYEVIPISALKGEGIALLESALSRMLPEGPMYYDPGQVTTHAKRFHVSEIVREKLFARVNQELPYQIAVEVEKWEERGELNVIHAVIYVAKSSHRAIVIGQGGEVLKQIGSQAREDIEKWLGEKVFLNLHVQLVKEWVESEKGMKKVGIGR